MNEKKDLKRSALLGAGRGPWLLITTIFLLGLIASMPTLVPKLWLQNSGRVAAQAVTRTVPGQFPTIQAAVNASNPGDIIMVAAGTFTEFVTIPAGKDGLIIRGAQTGVDARTRTGAESIVNGGFLANSSAITIDGFTVQNNTNGPGIQTSPAGSNYQILNNIIQNNVFGVYLNSGTGATQVQSRVFQNLIRTNNAAGAASGNGVYSDQGLRNAIILNNSFIEHGNAGVTLVNANPGDTDVIVNNNLFDDTVDPNATGVFGGGLFATRVANLAVTNNTFTGQGLTAVQLAGGVTNAQVNTNTFSLGEVRYVLVRDDIGGTPNSNLQINGNTFNRDATRLFAERGLIDFDGVAGTSQINNNTATFTGIIPANVAFADGIDIDMTTNAPGNSVTIMGNRIAGNNFDNDCTINSDGIFINALGNGSTLTIRNNALTGFCNGVHVGNTNANATVTININRIVGNTTASVNNMGGVLVNAENNFFGCNTRADLGGACNVVLGNLDVDPFLILQTTPATAMVNLGQTVVVTADLTTNSNGQSTTGMGTIPDGTPVTFSATGGTVNPTMTTTINGMAMTTFTAGNVAGPATVTAMVDNAMATTNITVIDPNSQVQLGAATFTVLESAGNAMITITRTGNTANTGSVTLTTTNGTATAPADYTTTTTTVTFAAGETSKTVLVPIIDDALAEGNETFNVTLSNATGTNFVLGTPTTAVVTITDNDAAANGNISFSSATYTGVEGTGSTLITINRTGNTTGTTTVTFQVTPGTATLKSDYIPPSFSTVTFNPGDTSKSFSIGLPDDQTAEPNETVNLQLVSATGGAAIVAPSTAVLTIVDNDPGAGGGGGLVQFSSATYTVAENGGSATITITRTGGSTGAASVMFATSDGTATAGSDYTATTTTVTFADGDAAPKTVMVPITDDVLVEGNETVNLTLTNATGAVLGTPNTATLTITDNDVAPTTIVINDVTVTEGDTGTVNATFTVTLNAASTQTVTVMFATANGTATAGSDYVATTGTLTFAPGATTQMITVPVNGDLLDEANETFFVNLTNATNATINDNQGMGTITDNDPTPSLVINDVTVAEGDAGTVNATFTVTLSAASGQPVTVMFTTADGTANAGSDFVANTGLLTFAPGTTTQMITVQVNGDLLAEPSETFFVNLSNPTNATLADGQGMGTITDNDTPGTVQFGAATFSAAENAGSATVTITRTGGTVGGVSVTLTTSNGTATAGSDYTATTTTVTFGANETSKTVTIPIIDDAIFEGNETVNLTLTNPTGGATLGTQSTAVLTITDNDAGAGGSIQFSSSTYNGLERNGSVTITVVRVGNTTGTVSVDFSTTPGTASPNIDYSVVSGTLTFAPGETTKTFFIGLAQDGIIEPGETVNLILTNPTGGATLGTPNTAVLTINDK